MDSADPTPSAFDELLDLRFRGAKIDAEAFLAAHPELTVSERDQIHRFCRGHAPDEPFAPTEGAGSAEAAAQAPPIARVGGYRLVRRIGAGGMGAVFLAEDEALGRPVAVKILGPDILGRGERSERFLREARAVARLHHPNIVDVYAAGEQDGFRYLAMELVRGSNLNELVSDAVARGTRLAVTDVVRWGLEIARALQAAHAVSIIHRDVKPSNIRITEGGRAVLLDFGLVLEDGAATLTESGGFRGSPQYASPEQIGIAGVPIDARTDIYSLGATLYEALTGIAPFRGETREQLFNHILSSDPVPPRRLDSTISRDLETVVLAALEKEPSRRYESASTLAADLEAIRDGRPISVRPVSPQGRLVRWARRQPGRAALAATAVVALIAAAALGGFVLSNLDRLDRAAATERTALLATLLDEAFLIYGESGEPALAIPMFEEALRVDPESREAHAGLALARASSGNPAAALAGLEAARASNEHWNALLRADALEQLGRPADAEVVQREPTRASAPVDYFVLGMLQIRQVHRGVAASAPHSFEHLRFAVLGSPAPNALYYHELGHAAWHAGAHKDAREVAAMIERLFPQSAENWFAIARTLQEADPEGSLRAIARAARPPPRSLNLRRWIAYRLAQSGQDDLAALGESLALDMTRDFPRSAAAHQALGAVRFAAREFEAAETELRESIRLEPSGAETYRMLAEVLLTLHRFAAAAPPAREAVRLNPYDARGWNVLGCALVEPKDLDDAIAAFEKALELKKNAPETQINLGRALGRRGEFARSLEILRQGHETGSKDPKWRYPQSKNWLANAQRWASLEKKWEAFRRGEDASPPINERIAFANEICRTKKRYAEAVKLFEESFRIDPDLAAPAGLRPTLHLLLPAAACALGAGLGEGVDAPADPAERARLREQARSWFEQDVVACEKALRDSPHRAEDLSKLAAEWSADPTIARTRQPAAGQVLPAEEAAAWSLVWLRWDALPRPAESRVSR